MAESMEPWIGMKEVSGYLQVTPETVRSWIRNKNLPAKKPGKSWLFKLSEIDDWLKGVDCGNDVLDEPAASLLVDDPNIVAISLFSGAGGLDIASFNAGVPVI